MSIAQKHLYLFAIITDGYFAVCENVTTRQLD